ncbi:MAG: hypothetical protein PHS59_07925 [Paludibacter sp.]|nr:hypothetical protein [Paludibacter sp.]
MISYSKTKTYTVLTILISIFLFTNCIDNEYDLSSGINTEISVGGDSLSFPIVKTTKIYLDSMMTSQDIQMLQRLGDSTYSFQLIDSMRATMGTLAPVTITVPSLSIEPIKMSFSDIELPTINLDPTHFQTAIEIPDFDIENKFINPINSSYTQTFPIDAPSYVKRNSGASKINSANIVVGPFQKTVSQSISQALYFSFPSQIKKINKVQFKNTKVTLTFDKTNTNLLNLVSQNDTIRELRIDFPSEYILSTAVGLNSKIEGSSFVIKNAILTQGVNIFTASFMIQSLDLTNIFQFESLSYNKSIDYSINYGFIGETNDINSLKGKNVEYKVSLQATPVIDDIAVITNNIESESQSGTFTVSKKVDNLPSEIAEIKTITFEDNAKLQLSIPDPGFYPFILTAGNCIIELPKSIIFKPTTGLNTSTNVLTLPFNENFGTKDLGISGLKINKTIPEGQNSFTITDETKYSISGVVIGSQETTLNAFKSLNDKQINITATCSGLVPKNAELTTNRISIDLAKNTTNINISKFVSKDVKRLYVAELKEPTDINIKINIKNFPSTIDSLFFENYVIQLPTYLKFKTGDVNSQNQVILNRGFKVSNGFTKTLTLLKLDFGVSGKVLEDGVFALNDEVSMQGKVYIKGANLNTSELGEIEILPSFKINDLALSIVEGEIKPEIPPVTKIMMMNFPNYLQNETTSLDLQNPVVTLQVGNTLGMEIHAIVTLIPKRNGIAINDAIVTSEIDIPAAGVIGQTSWFKYWIARTDAGISENYVPVIIPDISKLLNSVPDEVDIVVSPSLTGDRQIIDLYSTNNTLEMNYVMNIPLDFGTNFNLSYNDTLMNLKEKLRDIINYTRKIDVIAIIENKIPLDMNFEVIALDSLNQVIQGINIVSYDSIKSCNIDGSLKTNNLNLTINETKTGALDLLDAFAFKVSASKNTTVAGIPLKTDQFISLEIRVRIPDGITINQTNSN